MGGGGARVGAGAMGSVGSPSESLACDGSTPSSSCGGGFLSLASSLAASRGLR